MLCFFLCRPERGVQNRCRKEAAGRPESIRFGMRPGNLGPSCQARSAALPVTPFACTVSRPYRWSDRPVGCADHPDHHGSSLSLSFSLRENSFPGFLVSINTDSPSPGFSYCPLPASSLLWLVLNTMCLCLTKVKAHAFLKDRPGLCPHHPIQPL